MLPGSVKGDSTRGGREEGEEGEAEEGEEGWEEDYKLLARVPCLQ